MARIGQVIRKSDSWSRNPAVYSYGLQPPADLLIKAVALRTNGYLKYFEEDFPKNGSSVIEPQRQLDGIYTTVLENSVSHDYDSEEKEKVYATLKEVLGSVVIPFSPLAADSLASLLLPEEQVEKTLEGLHAILDIPHNQPPRGQPRPIRLHHPSFREFLLSKERCRNPHFWVDEKEAHANLAENCIHLMSTALRRDICGFRDPGTHASQIKSHRVNKCLRPEVQYACLYWVRHLQRGAVQLRDNGLIHQFLQVHLLHWLEALSLMRQTSEAVTAISFLESSVNIDRDPNGACLSCICL